MRCEGCRFWKKTSLFFPLERGMCDRVSLLRSAQAMDLYEAIELAEMERTTPEETAILWTPPSFGCAWGEDASKGEPLVRCEPPPLSLGDIPPQGTWGDELKKTANAVNAANEAKTFQAIWQSCQKAASSGETKAVFFGSLSSAQVEILQKKGLTLKRRETSNPLGGTEVSYELSW